MDEWKTKIPLAQQEDAYLAVRTMRSDIETFQKTGGVVPEVLIRKDLETISRPSRLLSIIRYMLYALLLATTLFFLFSFYTFLR